MQSRRSPVSITGAGAVTCAGLDLEAFWKNAVEETSGLNDAGLGAISEGDVEKLRARIQKSELMCKPTVLATAAIQEAIKQAGWTSFNEDDGLIVATTVGQIPLWEPDLIKYLQNKISVEEFGKTIVHQSLASIVESLQAATGFCGKSMLVTSACSAATQAIGLASLWIRQGKVKRCLVGGAEVLSGLTVDGFRSLQLLSTQPARPFDQNRQGINLSEGAAFFCLEADAGDRALAHVSGVGFSTDAYHMAAPHPEGRGSFEAMQTALANAGVSPEEIDWVHAHGTGSKANDQSEGAAIQQLFGARQPWVSSTKSVHGHALGASGAIEAALCVQAIRKKTILRTAGLSQPDPGISVKHPQAHIHGPIRHIVKNTLGFGGNNAALVLSAPNTGGHA